MFSRIKSEVIPLSEVPRNEWGGSLSQRRPVVLVVDDERLVADSLSTILSRKGFAVFTAYDGESALEFAEEIRPELLISDVAMPGISGVELALSVVQLVPDCKILLFSGHATVDDLSIARRAGYDFTLLSKPVHPSDLLNHISKFLHLAVGRSETLERPRSCSMGQLSSAD